MGTDSGNAIVLPGVVVPIISAVKVDDKNLEIQRPCENNVCEDPASGYVNAAYYAQWAVWGRKYNPYDFKYDKLNTLIYAFIGFDKTTGNIKTLDASADSWGLSAAARAAKKYPYFKAFLSFGGWTNNGKTTAPMFEQLASNEQSMKIFANQSIELMRKLGFNGIDIDWEWWSDYSADVAPAKKMLALYKILRTELDKAGKADGKKYYLAIAINGARSNTEAMENPNNPNSVADFWKQTGELMDEINIMSYDYQGAWAVGRPAWFQASAGFPEANFGTEVANSIGKTGGWSIGGSVNALIEAGVPAKKLVVGLPLYARSMAVENGTDGGVLQNVTGPGVGDFEKGVFDYKCLINPVHDPINGCGTSNPAGKLSDLVYYNINSKSDAFEKYGKAALQPWVYSPSSKTFITYDDVWSVGEKTKLVKRENLGGTMFWQADGDSTDPDKSLINAVAKVYAVDTINISLNNVTETSASLSWNKPELDGAIRYKVILNGEVIAEGLTRQNYILSNLEKDTKYTVEVIASTANTSREDSLLFETLGATNSDDQTSDDQSGAVTIGNWNSDKTYNKGDKVAIDGVTYEAQWFTKGENPLESGEWGVWRVISDHNSDDSTVSGTWNPKAVYSKGDEVTFNGEKYVAQWWTQGDQPSSSGAWKKPFVAGAAWSENRAYVGGQVVDYQGTKYKARWWTEGDIPSDGGVWEKL